MTTTPPKGYRPEIPVSVKFTVVLKQDGKCVRCGEKLHEWKLMAIDHRPPIQMRLWDDEIKDTVPAANDPEYLDAIHKDCHAKLTTGRQGESKLSKRGGDVSDIAKVKRLTAENEEFRKKLLTKGEEISDDPPVRLKQKIPSRPLQSRPFPQRIKRKPDP